MSKKSGAKSYPAELREKAVSLVTERGFTLQQVAAQLGCSFESVRRWKEAATQKLDPEVARTMKANSSVYATKTNACSRSRKGDCWDNAPCESWFGKLKTEWIYPNGIYATRQEAELSIIEYIEMFYNTKRLHHSLSIARRMKSRGNGRWLQIEVQ